MEINKLKRRGALVAALGCLILAAKSPAVTITAVTSDNGYPAHQVQWIDSSGQTRTAIMVDQNPTAPPYTGFLRQYTYQANGQPRVCTGTQNYADGGNLEFSGDGFVQNHTAASGDFSSGNGDGVPGTTTILLQGSSHAMIEYDMANYEIDGPWTGPIPQSVPTSVRWFFADGRDHPIFSISQDARGLEASMIGNLGGDSRSPYGDMAYDGDGVNAVVGGASYGDTYQFVTLASTPEELTINSGWKDTAPNTIPYAMEWAEPATVNAEMGHVATVPITVCDQGEDSQTYPPFDPRTQSQPNGPMLSDSDWGFQIANYQFPSDGTPVTDKHLAWGANYGRVGGFDEYGDYSDTPYLNITQYSQHSTDPAGEALLGNRADGMLMAYSVFVVFGPHNGSYTSGAVAQEVAQMENAAAATLSATVGTVQSSGPAGIGSASSATINYTPAGYNPTYAAWEIVAAAGNSVNATLSPAVNQALNQPLFIIDNYTGSQPPSSISLGNGQAVAGKDYYATVDTSNQRLWLTINHSVSSPLNLTINPGGGGLAQSAFTVLHTFLSDDGTSPAAGLTLAGDVLYGTTLSGTGDPADDGPDDVGSGVIFTIRCDGTGYHVVHNFASAAANGSGAYTNSGGSNPHGTLVCSDGVLYGTARSGGSVGRGDLFSVETNGDSFSDLHDFTGGGPAAGPVAGVTQSGSILYGTTWAGSVFSYTLGGSGYSSLYASTDTGPNAGVMQPWAGVAVVNNLLYGTDSDAGKGKGTVFSLPLTGGTPTIVHTFAGSDGATPYGGLVASGNTLYGTTSGGGSSGYGTVFSVTTGGTYKVLYNFTNGVDGAEPVGDLLLWSNTLYGVANLGGTAGYGAIFALPLNGSGLTALYNFTNGADGAFPQGGLLITNDTLFGTATGSGVADNFGTVFSLSLGQFVPEIAAAPSSGMAGDPIVINGLNFTSALSVLFNGVPATFVVNSAKELLVTVPPGATTGIISVTTPDGIGRTLSSFTVLPPPPPPPVLSSIPASGAIGSSILIEGQNFTGATAVEFNGVAALFKVDATNQITATVPNGATSGPISVTTPAGAATSATTFNPIVPATNLVIYNDASGLVNGFQDYSWATDIIMDTVQVYSGTYSISVTAGAYEALSLYNPAGVDTSPYSYLEFWINGGTEGAQGLQVLGVEGTNFQGIYNLPMLPSNTWVQFAIPLSDLGVSNVPACNGLWIWPTNAGPLTFYVDDVQLAVSPPAPPPAISSFAPTAVAGTLILIDGQNFDGATEVQFDGLDALFTIESDNQIAATVPTDAQAGLISVTTPGGTVASAAVFTPKPPVNFIIYDDTNGLVNGFEDYSWATDNMKDTKPDPVYSGTYSIKVTAGAYEALSFYNPGGVNTGPYNYLEFWLNGGAAGAPGLQVLGVVGTNYLGVYNLPPLAPNVWVQFAIPLSALGVSNAPACNGFWIWPTNDSPTTFYVDAVELAGSNPVPLPSIYSFPSSAVGGSQIIINGQDFTGTTAVSFNGLNALFTVNSSNQITATVPAAATSGILSITTPGGTTTSLTIFTPLPPSILVIYDDTNGLVNGFQDDSWAIDNNMDTAPDPVYSGAYSISVTAGAYDALSFYNPAGVNTAAYNYLDFWINGGTAGAQGLQVLGVVGTSDQGIYNLPPLASNTWNQFAIPLSALGVSNVPACNGFWIWPTNAGPTTFYVDAVQLTVLAPTVISATASLSAARSSLQSGAIILQLAAQPGSSYTIQTSTDLINWANVSTMILASSPASITNALLPGAEAQFWRVVQP